MSLARSKSSSSVPQAAGRWSIAVHGGYLEQEHREMSPQLEAAYRAGLLAALLTGSDILNRSGSSIDAVESAIRVLEDNPLFNAGRGAAFTADGGHELDASIMNGATLAAGAVTGVKRTRYPISLARKVIESSPYVMMAGDGADAFGAIQGLEQVPPSFFSTNMRWQVLVERCAKQGRSLPTRPTSLLPACAHSEAGANDGPPVGTVGAVARDEAGHVAAGTSTGGMTGKMWGRIGDSPIIGAGTYASDQSGAVSCTGSGEHFIRLTLAREICALVEYRSMTLQAASDEVIHNRLTQIGGEGGAIGVTPTGEIAWSYGANGLFRGKATEGSDPIVAIYNHEP